MQAKKLIPLLALLAAACHPAPTTAPEPKAELRSPDGQLRLCFYLSDEGTPRYALSCGDTPVLLPSRLGFSLRESAQRLCAAKHLVEHADIKVKGEDDEEPAAEEEAAAE